MSDAQPSMLVTARALTFLNARGYPMTKPTLLKLSRAGKGPSFVRWGNRNIYDPAELLKWAESRGKRPDAAA